ncbi:hypothetical protein PR202_gb03182 [Eleusine coracana subsp. coracana]|uniref:Uncharacterized protein n=1 Tax=Eleusine coracana subsp. coracana TaxID=191504 RepID=A0AAV5E1D1_ELECO|nr:hypothetical protein PR202_gb03182 [Eleusine coracana subsp. coracana]
MLQSPPAPEPEKQLWGRRLCTRRVSWRLALPEAMTATTLKTMEGGRGAMWRRRAWGRNTMEEGKRGWVEEAHRPIQTLPPRRKITPPRRKRRRWRRARATGKGSARGRSAACVGSVFLRLTGLEWVLGLG